MLFNTIKLQLQIADKMYHFFCDNDAPIQHVKESLVQMLSYAQRVEEQIKAQRAQAVTEESKKEVQPDISPEQPKEVVNGE